jgi:hypothetical protein
VEEQLRVTFGFVVLCASFMLLSYFPPEASFLPYRDVECIFKVPPWLVERIL